MQDNYSKLRSVGPSDLAKSLVGGAIGGVQAAPVGALDEITKRIVSGNSRLYELMLRARRIADAAFGETGAGDGADTPRPAPACKVSVLDEAASATHRILSELEMELERLAQL